MLGSSSTFEKKEVIEEGIIKKGIKKGEQNKVNTYRQIFLIMENS